MDKTTPLPGVRFISPNAVTILRDGSVHPALNMETVSKLPMLLLTYDETTPQQLRALLEQPLHRTLALDTMRHYYGTKQIETPSQSGFFTLSMDELQDEMGVKWGAEFYHYIHTHPDVPLNDWLPVLYEKITGHLHDNAEAICEAAELTMRGDHMGAVTAQSLSDHSNTMRDVMVNAPLPSIMGLSYILSEWLTESAIRLDKGYKGLQSLWAENVAVTKAAFEILPKEFKTLAEHKGLQIVCGHHPLNGSEKKDTVALGYAPFRRNFIFVNHLTRKGPTDREFYSLMYEEMCHKVDQWLEFSTQDKWRDAVERDRKFNPSTLTAHDYFREHLGKASLYGSFSKPTYAPHERPAEMLAEIFVMDELGMAPPGHTLKDCFHYCWPLYQEFREQAKDMATALEHGLPLPNVRGEDASIDSATKQTDRPR